MNLTDARVVLTGAAGGIGSAIAQRLANAGATLLVTDLRQEPLDRLARQLAPTAPRTVVADIGSDSGRAALAAAARELGADVLINAAGINPFGMFGEQTAAEIGKAFAINAIAPILLCHALLPVLRERPRAHIVNVGSTFGSIGFPGFAAYSASKFAVRGFTEALRQELAATNVRVTSVHPGGIKTNIVRNGRHFQDVAGNADPEVVAREFDRMARTSPEEAARQIAHAILRRKPRLLIGLDAILIDRMQRLMPASYDGLVAKAVARRPAAN